MAPSEWDVLQRGLSAGMLDKHIIVTVRKSEYIAKNMPAILLWVKLAVEVSPSQGVLPEGVLSAHLAPLTSWVPFVEANDTDQ